MNVVYCLFLFICFVFLFNGSYSQTSRVRLTAFCRYVKKHIDQKIDFKSIYESCRVTNSVRLAEYSPLTHESLVVDI